MIQCQVGVQSFELFARHVTSMVLKHECAEAIIVILDAGLYDRAESKISCSLPWLMQQIHDSHQTTIILAESVSDLMDIVRVIPKKPRDSKHILATYNLLSQFTDTEKQTFFARSDDYPAAVVNNVVHDLFNLQQYENVSVIMGENEEGSALWSRKTPCARGVETKLDLIAKKWLIVEGVR